MPVKHPEGLKFRRIRIEVHPTNPWRLEQFSGVEILRHFAEHESAIPLSRGIQGQSKAEERQNGEPE